jgi:hypothetical protein
MTALEELEPKIFDDRFKWSDIDKDKALTDTRVLDLVREACLIESYFAVYTGKMLQLFWYDVRATSMYTIEAFEAYKHFYCLRRYLDIVGYCPVADKEVVALRRNDVDKTYDDEARELVNFMATEHFASHFFGALADKSPEPVLTAILKRMSVEEVIHARFAFDLLAERLAEGKITREDILSHAKDFRHVGAYVLPKVSNVEEDNVKIINAFGNMVEKLTGVSLTEFMAMA